MASVNPFKRAKQSFHTRIFLFLALLILVISTTFVTVYVRHESASDKKRLVTEGELFARLLAHNSRLAVFAEHEDMLREAADGILENDRVLSATTFSAGGKLLANRTRTVEEGNGEEWEGFAAATASFARLREGEKKLFHIEKTDRLEFYAPVMSGPSYSSSEYLYFADSPTEHGLRAIGIARVVLDKKELNARRHALLATGFLMGVLFLVPALGIAFVVARGVTRPLNRLMEGVKNLEVGDLSARIPVETDDELGKVSRAFNSMAQTLEQREAENRELAEQLLQTTEERLRLVTEAIDDVIWMTDVNVTKILYISPAYEQVWGQSLKSLYENPSSFIDPVHPDDRKLMLTTLESQKTGEHYEIEYRLVKPDGSIRWIWDRGYPVRDKAGEVVSYTGVARDVTLQKLIEEEKKAIQAKLVQTNKMTSLGLLVSGLAHEVNNPNNSIKLTAHLLARSWRDILPALEKQYREEGDFTIGGQPFSAAKELLPQHISGIRTNSRRIEGIIKNLRDFARKGAADLNFKAEINTIVSVAASLLNTQIRRCTRHFTLDLQEGVPAVRGNPQQLEQVVINLIMNAIQALPDKERRVLVATSFDRDGGGVVIEVIDEGEGMPPEVRERICEPFFSTKLDKGGTGLGLAISNFIVREHKGTLEFESEPGKGTTAIVRLPVT